MPDRFAEHAIGLDSPATHGFHVSPNDAVDLPDVTRAIYVGGSGALEATLVSGADISLAGIAAGTILPLRIRRIKATGTTATFIVGLL
ncbi:spike base protein, RCAP_Rcc01079 family [Devosia sp.]|uniref:spike base protein, RCAP_Rcc01079 family n=1 Tax=Devosia sp. TaxID=1871048 RepID=UPI002FC70404